MIVALKGHTVATKIEMMELMYPGPAKSLADHQHQEQCVILQSFLDHTLFKTIYSVCLELHLFGFFEIEYSRRR